ncbi:hypothetical protein GA0070622_4095 [Micromonospora sediminicola]|uniref:Uncharacterized protein n=1 Tax=Micromonospora sediminicola TaxID=946078 RepID=A0A1A9BD01_9ACTN|nr:hypothetical protein [Micromonospora sediminicola]SBT67043.1 hypothetical protein GA0070622_4095 [Micromonospora sediminicola]
MTCIGVPACRTTLPTSSLSTSDAGPASSGTFHRPHASVTSSRARRQAPATGSSRARSRGDAAVPASAVASAQSRRTGTTRQAVVSASHAAVVGGGAERTIGTAGQSAARRAAAANTDSASGSVTSISSRSTTSASGCSARHRSSTSCTARIVPRSSAPASRTTVTGDSSRTSHLIRVDIGPSFLSVGEDYGRTRGMGR